MAEAMNVNIGGTNEVSNHGVGIMYINPHFKNEEWGRTLLPQYFIQAKNRRYYTREEESKFWLQSRTKLPTLGNCDHCFGVGKLGYHCLSCNVPDDTTRTYKCIRYIHPVYQLVTLLDAEKLGCIFGQRMQDSNWPQGHETFDDTFYTKVLTANFTRHALRLKLQDFLKKRFYIPTRRVMTGDEYADFLLVMFLPDDDELESRDDDEWSEIIKPTSLKLGKVIDYTVPGKIQVYPLEETNVDTNNGSKKRAANGDPTVGGSGAAKVMKKPPPTAMKSSGGGGSGQGKGKDTNAPTRSETDYGSKRTTTLDSDEPEAVAQDYEDKTTLDSDEESDVPTMYTNGPGSGKGIGAGSVRRRLEMAKNRAHSNC